MASATRARIRNEGYYTTPSGACQAVNNTTYAVGILFLAELFFPLFCFPFLRSVNAKTENR
jgi:hypothetical protein